MKKTILVLFGGVSTEHDVSLVSAGSVIDNLSEEKYDVKMLGITKTGECFLYTGKAADLPESGWLKDKSKLHRAVISCDRSHHGAIDLETGEIIRVDCVFPVLHGMNGEDGTMQGLLEISGIPFVGCDTASSAVCMDKALTNAICDFYGIPQAKWSDVRKYDFEKYGRDILPEKAEKLGYPIFVKPCKAGSSVGISKANNFDELVKACETAFKVDTKLVLEENIVGQEIECAVMGNEEPVASLPGEIVPCNDFYDYDAKYVANKSELHIPARLSEETLQAVREAAKKVYSSLGCTGFSRVDFFVRKSDGKVMLNEVNTIPGFTSISMYPKMFEKSGVPYSELLDRLIEYAEKRSMA